MNEDRASRYQRLKRRARLAAIVWTGTLLALLVATGASQWLADTARAAAARWTDNASGALARWLYVCGLLLVHEAGSATIAYQGEQLLERRYGLSTQNASGWWIDRTKSFALVLTVVGVGTEVVYRAIDLAPTWWWAIAGATFGGALLCAVGVAPMVLLPIFYRIEPLSRDALRTKLLALAARGRTRVLGAYLWDGGTPSQRPNAALAGLGGSRRILVSPAMLADYSDDEIEVVLAHEMAHYVHGDSWKSLCVEGAVVFAALLVASRALVAWAEASGRPPADIAGLPIVLIAAGSVSIALRPVAHALSRARERRADRYAIRLTENPAAFVSAMRRLGAQNLAEVSPSPLVRWLFHSHPTFEERIAAAEASRQSSRVAS